MVTSACKVKYKNESLRNQKPVPSIYSSLFGMGRGGITCAITPSNLFYL